ncbi:MAG TPA: hypothetical protein PLO30_07435, partial [Methanothrix soehngenii]|nr:hypothetical protein [Methanothrix soehngenii]
HCKPQAFYVISRQGVSTIASDSLSSSSGSSIDQGMKYLQLLVGTALARLGGRDNSIQSSR